MSPSALLPSTLSACDPPWPLIEQGRGAPHTGNLPSEPPVAAAVSRPVRILEQIQEQVSVGIRQYQFYALESERVGSLFQCFGVDIRV